MLIWILSAKRKIKKIFIETRKKSLDQELDSLTYD